MTVLILSEMFPNPENASSGIFVLDQVRALHRQGVEFQVIAPVPWIPGLFRSARKWRKYSRIPSQGFVEGIRVHYLRLPMLPAGWLFWLTGIIYYLGCRRLVRDLVRKHNVALIHAHAIMPLGFAAVLLGRKFKLPVTCTAHGSDVNVQPFTNWRNRRAAQWALRRVPRLFAVSHDLKRKMVQLAGERPIQVVPNGADSQLFHPMPKGEARAQVGLPEDKKIVLFIGNLIPVKNVSLLLQAFSRLQSRNTLLYLLGDGPLKEKLRAEAIAAGIGESCRFMGRRPHDEIATCLAAADCLVITSKMEGLPTIVPEAMLCRTPIVATRVGGIPEVIVNGESGLLTESDAGEIATAIHSLLSDRELASRLAENAAALAHRDLTWRANAAQVLRAYEEMTHASTPAEPAWRRAESRA